MRLFFLLDSFQGLILLIKNGISSQDVGAIYQLFGRVFNHASIRWMHIQVERGISFACSKMSWQEQQKRVGERAEHFYSCFLESAFFATEATPHLHCRPDMQ